MIQINIAPFKGTLYITKCREEYLKKRNEFKEPVPDISDCIGIASDENNCHVVGIFDGTVSTLMHELAHVCFKVLEYCSIEVSANNSEVFCYLQEYLMIEVLKELEFC